MRFRFRLAGPLVRAFAWLIDAVLRGIVVTAFGVVAMLVGAIDETLSGLGTGALLLFVFLIDWGYGATF